MEKKIYTALASIMREVGAIGKNNKNISQNFVFRGVEDVMNELHGLFAKNNVVIQTRIISAEKTEKMTKNGGVMFHTTIQVVFRFIAEDGSHLSCRMIGEAMDSGDKGLNKAVSVALKYALTTMFLIPTKEFEDPDAQSHEISQQQAEKQWLTELEFEKIMQLIDIERLEKALSYYSGENRAMKKAYREQIQNKINELKKQ